MVNWTSILNRRQFTSLLVALSRPAWLMRLLRCYLCVIAGVGNEAGITGSPAGANQDVGKHGAADGED